MDVIRSRTDAVPNIDLAVGALTFLSGMPASAGEVIFAISRAAGWIAHTAEEYAEEPHRVRARYVVLSLLPELVAFVVAAANVEVRHIEQLVFARG